MIRALCLAAMLAAPVSADTVVATRTIRAQSQIGETDVTLSATQIVGGIDQLSGVIGKEARVTLYAGRPVQAKDVGPVAIVDRNQLITLSYFQSGLHITAEGRALARGGVGDRIRIMNLTSRATLSGTIQADGSVIVGAQ